jgi:hypothetical protein
MVGVLKDGGSGTRNISRKRQFLTEKHGSCKLAKNVAEATFWQRHMQLGGRRSEASQAHRRCDREPRHECRLLSYCHERVTWFCGSDIDDGTLPPISRERPVTLQACPASPEDLYPVAATHKIDIGRTSVTRATHVPKT